MNDEEILKKPYKEKWSLWSQKGKEEQLKKATYEVVRDLKQLFNQKRKIK